MFFFSGGVAFVADVVLIVAIFQILFNVHHTILEATVVVVVVAFFYVVVYVVVVTFLLLSPSLAQKGSG